MHPVIFTPPAPVLPAPILGPSSSIYPSLQRALDITRSLNVRPTTQTLKRIERVEDPSEIGSFNPRPRKRQSVDRPADDDVVSLGWDSDLDPAAPAFAAGPSHWGQGPVYPAGTLQVHCKEMDKVPTKNPSGTLQTHSEFPKPISLQCSQHRKCPVHSQCSGSCDCSVPIR